MPSISEGDGQAWATFIRASARPSHISALIENINRFLDGSGCKKSEVVLCCAQILAQDIAGADTAIARELRAGIMALIDGYAMQEATSRA